MGLVEVTKWFPQNVSLHFLKIHFKTLQIAAKHFKTIQNTTSAASRKMRSMTGFHYQKYKIFQNKQFQTKMNATIELGPQMVLTHHSAVIIFNSKSETFQNMIVASRGLVEVTGRFPHSFVLNWGNLATCRNINIACARNV